MDRMGSSDRGAAVCYGEQKSRAQKEGEVGGEEDLEFRSATQSKGALTGQLEGKVSMGTAEGPPTGSIKNLQNKGKGLVRATDGALCDSSGCVFHIDM